MAPLGPSITRPSISRSITGSFFYRSIARLLDHVLAQSITRLPDRSFHWSIDQMGNRSVNWSIDHSFDRKAIDRSRDGSTVDRPINRAQQSSIFVDLRTISSTKNCECLLGCKTNNWMILVRRNVGHLHSRRTRDRQTDIKHLLLWIEGVLTASVPFTSNLPP